MRCWDGSICFDCKHFHYDEDLVYDDDGNCIDEQPYEWCKVDRHEFNEDGKVTACEAFER